ncbi:MAG: tyrosine-type recombinase/integrase [Candidatus Obscuribacterales bacterium]|nr:tyrosine-type recombinase/integrase [Candidatus Obscuribacterales bacterium]
MVKIILPPRLTEMLSRYNRELSIKNLSAHTKRAYISRNKKFASYLYEKEGILDIDAPIDVSWTEPISRYKEHLKNDNNASHNSINNSLTAIEDLFNFLGIDPGSIERESWPKSTPKFLLPEEQERFVDTIFKTKSTKDRAIALLLLYTGIKIGECVSLDVDDIYITAHTGRIAVKDGRVIPLNTVARRAIVQWLIDRHKKFGETSQRALFLNPQGKRLSTVGVDLIVRKIGHKAHLNLSAQVLRDTCLTNLVKNGNDLLLVAQIGGHRTIETTRRYSAVGQTFDALQAMEGLKN